MARGIRELEDAILALLAPLKAQFPRLVLDTYAQDLDAEDAQRLAGRAPALLVVYSGSRESGPGQRRAEALTWTVFVLARSWRDGEERRGGPDQPGAYALLDALRAALAGRQPFEDAGALALERQQAVVFAQGLVVYAAAYGLTQHHHAGC